MPQAFKTTKKERGHFANHSFGKKKQNNNNKKTIKTHHHSKVKYSDNAVNNIMHFLLTLVNYTMEQYWSSIFFCWNWALNNRQQKGHLSPDPCGV